MVAQEPPIFENSVQNLMQSCSEVTLCEKTTEEKIMSRHGVCEVRKKKAPLNQINTRFGYRVFKNLIQQNQEP